jgi:hypothetical protein
MKRILFASLHGSASSEMALLCKAAGVELQIALAENGLVKSLAKEGDVPARLGVAFRNADGLRDDIAAGKFDMVLLSSPGQIVEFRKNIVPLRKIPFAIRHGLNSFDKFKHLDTKNFISPSLVALAKMPECNSFLSRKLVDWDALPKPSFYGDEREGFFQYVHHLQKWPAASARFAELCRLCAPIEIKNFGYDSQYGVVDDIGKMSYARGTTHIKDGQAACNAVIRSMAMGTPVFMDGETFRRCHFDQVRDIVVRNTVQELADDIRRAAGDNSHLESLCRSTYESARRQFVPDADVCGRFVSFMGNLRI